MRSAVLARRPPPRVGSAESGSRRSPAAKEARGLLRDTQRQPGWLDRRFPYQWRSGEQCCCGTQHTRRLRNQRKHLPGNPQPERVFRPWPVSRRGLQATSLPAAQTTWTASRPSPASARRKQATKTPSTCPLSTYNKYVPGHGQTLRQALLWVSAWRSGPYSKGRERVPCTDGGGGVQATGQ